MNQPEAPEKKPLPEDLRTDEENRILSLFNERPEPREKPITPREWFRVSCAVFGVLLLLNGFAFLHLGNMYLKLFSPLLVFLLVLLLPQYSGCLGYLNGAIVALFALLFTYPTMRDFQEGPLVQDSRSFTIYSSRHRYNPNNLPFAETEIFVGELGHKLLLPGQVYEKLQGHPRPRRLAIHYYPRERLVTDLKVLEE